MKVLADYHHGNLYYSLHLLFEKRLGFELYRPIGLDWFRHGFFKIAEPYENPEPTIQQYLGMGNTNWNAFKSLNGGHKIKGEVYHIEDKENNFSHKAITFETFKKMEFDYIVGSFPSHGNWGELLEYQPKAKFIMQLGNEGQTTGAENVLCSTNEFKPNENQKTFFYHQEFDLTDYGYTDPTNHNKITSFVVLLPERDKFMIYKDALPDFDFKAYGPGAIDGTLGDGEGISTEMKKSAFAFHNKPSGDGYGHVIHKWYASGRPAIINYGVYSEKLAGKLLIPDKTCINLDEPFADVCRKIRFFSQPKEHKKMCEAAYQRFTEVCDFDKEAKDFKEFLTTI